MQIRYRRPDYLLSYKSCQYGVSVAFYFHQNAQPVLQFHICNNNFHCDVRNHSGIWLFFYFKFRELVEPDFFPGTLERSRTVGASKKLAPRLSRWAAPRTYGEGSVPLATLSAAHLPTFLRRRAATYQRAHTLAHDRRRSIFLCFDFSEHTRPPRSTGDGLPGLLQALVSSVLSRIVYVNPLMMRSNTEFAFFSVYFYLTFFSRIYFCIFKQRFFYFFTDKPVACFCCLLWILLFETGRIVLLTWSKTRYFFTVDPDKVTFSRRL